MPSVSREMKGIIQVFSYTNPPTPFTAVTTSTPLGRLYTRCWNSAVRNILLHSVQQAQDQQWFLFEVIATEFTHINSLSVYFWTRRV